jgi:hypothetical protein
MEQSASSLAVGGVAAGMDEQRQRSDELDHAYPRCSLEGKSGPTGFVLWRADAAWDL